MEYYINPAALAPFFTVPCEVADKHIKLASETALRVLLYILRNSGSEINAQKAAEFFRTDIDEIRDALDYWSCAGILIQKDGKAVAVQEPAVPKKAPRSRSVKPTREEVVRRGNEDEKIRFLLCEAQMKFGRVLKANESATLVWLFDDAGIDVSLILMAAEYAAAQDGCNIRAVERIALDWADHGVKSITDAEKRISTVARQQTAWRLVEAAFGMEHRMPSTKEMELAQKWVDEWKMSRDMLHAAYEHCVDATAKLSFPYIKKILESWHKKGYTTPAQIKDNESTAGNGKAKYAAYDMDAFLKKLNSED